MLQRVQPVWFSSWAFQIGVTIAIAVTYFLAAQMSLALLTKPDGVAVFWPAAGISSGTLIAFGSRVRLSVIVGVVTASTAASLLGDRNLAAATVFALCNIGEPLLVAWLIQRHFGEDFRLESLRSVVGFFLAAGIGPAASASLATVGFILFYSPTAPVLTTWLNWFASDALGIIMVAPLLVGFANLRSHFPERRELIRGALMLVALVFVSPFLFGSTGQHWYTAIPLAVLLAILLAAHCQPVFAAAAALIFGVAVVWTTTFGFGGLGELPDLHDRAYAARASLLAISSCTLVLAALFAERRRNESALKDGNHRLQLALDCAELGTWSLHLKTGRFENDVRDRRIHGHDPEAAPQTLAKMRSQVHPDDLSNLDAAFLALGRAGGSCRTEYRLAPLIDQERNGYERWVALEGAVVRQADGQSVQLLGVTRDITDRKLAEQALAERNAQLALAGKIALVGSLNFNLGSEKMQVSPGYAAIHGLPEGTAETSRADWRARVHPDDLPRVEANLRRDIDGRRSEHYCDYRIVRPGGEIRWIEARSFILYDGDRAALRIVGANIDVTERKIAELALAERNVQLALAGKAGLVGTYAHDATGDVMQVSEGYAAIHGLPERTTETSRIAWSGRVEPEDLARKMAVQRIAFRERRGEYSAEYRIVRHGEVRWVESRSFVFYDNDGRPQRVIGVNIDITERKQADEHQRALIDELDHRVKNALATVSAIAGQTLETSGSMDRFVAAFDGRIRSMAVAHELLSIRQWRGLPMAELVQREFAAYARSNNTKIDGPEVVLSAEAGQAMGMVIHELVTNAVKYGALSTLSGHVSVRWYRKLNGTAQFVLEWQETGGPRVEAPMKSGYGSGVVRDLIPYEFGGTVDYRFPPEGVRCRLEIPFDQVSSDNSNASAPERLRHAGGATSALSS